MYSFGIVLLELITGQSAIVKGADRVHLLEWISPFVETRDIQGLVDPRLQGDFDMVCVCKALDIAMTCTASTSRQRPTMSEVLSELKNCSEMEVSNERRERTEMWRKQSDTIVYDSTEVYSMDFSSVTAR